MKINYHIVLLGLFGILMSGCVKEPVVQEELIAVGESQLKVTAVIEQDPDTKVSFEVQEMAIVPSWEIGDQVFGFYGENKLTYEVASVADGVATFSLVNGTEPADATTVHMIYAPGKGASDIVGGRLAVDFSQQDGTLTGLKNHAIMCATATVSGTSLELIFQNQVAILGVKQYTGLKSSTTYTSATFTTNGPTATVKVEAGVLKLVTDDAYGAITASGSFTSDASGNTSETIYFAVPPTSAVEHQFSLTCDTDYRIGAISARAVSAGDYLCMTSKALRECVDLGLPSHTLWAATNVGASSPEGFGDYFAWGEVEIQASGRYWWDSYKWGNASSSNSGLTKYNSTDGLTRLLPEDDAATVNWKNSWRIPTKAEFDELINTTYTTSDWTTQNGVRGMRITSKINGKSIFLPAAGLKDYGYENRDPGACNYPTSDLMTSEISHCHNYKYNSNRQSSNYGRCGGRPVRAVIAPMALPTAPAPVTTGIAPVLSSAGCPDNECGWVQLWENGPKWAVFNVGVTDGKPESYGNFYTYGADSELWGSNWHLPTKQDFDNLLAECDKVSATINGVKGMLVSGKGSYSSNEVFFPAGGYNDPYSSPSSQRIGELGRFWSITDGSAYACGFCMGFGEDPLDPFVGNGGYYFGHSVRLVLAE